jgi:hypothetical protein
VNPNQFTNRQTLLAGALFGAWVFGWPLTADWLMHSGILAKLLGLDPAKFALPSMLELILGQELLWLAQSKVWLLGFSGVVIASCASALIVWLVWKLASITEIDSHALAANSILWVARATVSVSFLLLMGLCAALVYAVIVLRDLTGWSYWTFAPMLSAVLFVGFPLQLCQKSVVQGETMGRWWGIQWPSIPVIVGITLVIASAWAVGLFLSSAKWFAAICWILVIVSDAVIATLLVQRGHSRAATVTAVKTVLWWPNLRIWLVQELLVMCVALAIAMPMIAISYLNIFGTPALVAALAQVGLEKPRWFAVFVQVSDYFRNYWYVAFIVGFLWPLAGWQALLSARLAYLQTHSTQ